MKEERVLDLLSAHADALNRGEPHDAWLSRQTDLPAELPPLLETARILQRTLIPLPVPTRFQSRLLSDLQATMRRRSWRARPRIWVGAAAVGSLLSLVGLLFFWQRRRLPQVWNEHLNFSS